MRHPTERVLRRLADQPAGVTDAERGHVAGCTPCLASLTALREGRLGTPTGTNGDPNTSTLDAGPRRAPRRGRVPRRPAVAGLAVVLVLAGAGTAAANDWLPISEAARIEPVRFRTADLTALPDLSAYGDVEVTRELDVRTVPSATAASAETGMAVPLVAALPRGVRGEPVHQTVGEVSATFTFSAARAAQASAANGGTPPGLDGSRLRLVAGPGVASIWARPTGVPALIVARAVAPKAFSDGVPFEVMRDHLVSLPGVPDDVAEQLRRLAGDGPVLPLPVPDDDVTTSPVEIGDGPATAVATRDRTIAAVVWLDAGVVTVVAGSLDVAEVVSIARELR